MNYEKEIDGLQYVHVKALAMKIVANPAVAALVEQGLACNVTVSDGHDVADEYFVISKGQLSLRNNRFPDERQGYNAAELNNYFLEDYVQLHGSLDGLRCFITGAFDIR